MIDPIKKTITDLKPGHTLLPAGRRVVTGRKVYRDQVPSELIRPKEPSKGKTGAVASTDPYNSPGTPQKAAEDNKETGAHKGSGSAVSDKKLK